MKIPPSNRGGFFMPFNQSLQGEPTHRPDVAIPLNRHRRGINLPICQKTNKLRPNECKNSPAREFLMAYVTEANLQRKAEKWSRLMVKYNTHRLKLDSRRGALLVIDMQNFFLKTKSPTYTEGGTAILPTVTSMIG